jgi:hypothetical protein
MWQYHSSGVHTVNVCATLVLGETMSNYSAASSVHLRYSNVISPEFHSAFDLKTDTDYWSTSVSEWTTSVGVVAMTNLFMDVARKGYYDTYGRGMSTLVLDMRVDEDYFGGRKIEMFLVGSLDGDCAKVWASAEIVMGPEEMVEDWAKDQEEIWFDKDVSYQPGEFEEMAWL